MAFWSFREVGRGETLDPSEQDINSENPIVEIKNISFRFRESQRTALQNISLDLYPREVVLLTGPSGSGKSTLSLCLNGLIPHLIDGELDGQVVVAGMDTADHSVREMATKVGIIFQDPEAQLCNLYVRNEIAFGCENILLPVEIIKERIDHYTSLLGLSNLKDSLCDKLSGGQKQRVALASVLAMEPQLLILDEPTSNLDNLGIYNIIQCLKTLREKTEVTILIIEHKIDEIIHLVDRIIVMDKGQIILQGAPRKVYSEYGNYLRSNVGAWIPQVVEFALELKEEKDLALHSLPITIDEAYNTVDDWNLEFSDAVYPKETPTERAPLFVLEEVSYEYDRKVKVLNEISLTINKGDVVAIIGPNGSGKTTLGKLLVGLLKPGQGKIFYQNDEITSIPISQLATQVGYVFQNLDAQFIKKTVLEEIYHSLTLVGSPHDNISQMADELLNKYGLLNVKHHYPLDLSIGEKRSLSLAILNPFPLKACILDEPSMGLDYVGATRLMDMLKEKRRDGTTIIMITHEMRFLTDFVERVIVLDSGNIVADISPQDFYNSSDALDLLSVVEPPVVTLSKRLMRDIHDDSAIKLALTPQELCKRLIGRG